MSRHAAAKVFSVGVSSVIRWCQRLRETGSFSPKPIGGSRGCRIEGEDRDWSLQRIAERPDLTLEEMRREPLTERGLAASHGAVWRFCDREQLTFKKLCTPRSKSGLTSPKPARFGASNSRRWTSSAWCSSTRPGPRTT